MKLTVKNSLLFLAASIISLQSCTNEAPFETVGDGVLRLDTEFRSDINISTRAAIAGYDVDYLNNNLVVYIENSKGVVRKYIGKDQIPEVISLPVGKYVVEGWTGDSISASFDKKFFRGYQKDIEIGSGNNSMSLKLDIANVVVSVDKIALQQGISDLKIKFYHSRGELEFTTTEIEAEKRGYFMMPNADNDLHYIIEGKNSLGEPFSKAGDLKDVERAHLYNFNLTSEPQENTSGGALIKIEIQDIPIIEERFEILPAPSFKLNVAGEEADFEDQLVSTNEQNNFKDAAVRVLVYEEISSLIFSCSANISGMENISGVNLVEQTDPQSLLSSKNIRYQIIESNDISKEKGKDKVKVIETWITFTSEFLNSLNVSDEEMVITITATDARGYSKSADLKIANTENAITHQDPVVSDEMIEAILPPMAILATSAEITGSIYDETVSEYGIMYRKQNEGSFVKVPASALSTKASTSSKQFTVVLSDLDPGTVYEYKSYADNFEEKTSKTFTTESKYQIPNGNMSDWSKDGNIYVPSASGKVEFWDNGNHGSFMISALLGGKNISMPDDDFLGNGNRVGKLKSDAVMSVMAAGNLFVGEYINNDGMDGADLNFGRPYNGSHPSAMKVKVNYRPGTVDKYKEREETSDLQNKGTDHGQIFIAIASAQSELHTAKGVMFDPNGDNILGYGEITMKQNVGENNQLQDITIPITYYEKAKQTKATHIIIVCSASKYGDYFTGSTSSVMYVDDFELEYGDIQWQD